jgi:Type IV leader peptidase family.
MLVFIELAIFVTSVPVFAAAGFSDAKRREVDPRVWAPAIAVGTAVNTLYAAYFGLDVLQKIQLLASLAFVVLVGYLSLNLYRDVIGGADFLAILSVSCLHPFARVRGHGVLLLYTPPAVLVSMLSFLVLDVCVLAKRCVRRGFPMVAASSVAAILYSAAALALSLRT